MSDNSNNSKGDSLKTDGRSDLATSERTTKRHKVITFPGRHANGAAHVYQKDLCYRDNSSYLETLFNHESNALCFTRPMQLGKSILFSLANELFSRNENSNVDSDLGYSPGEDDRNKWYVLRINFGVVRSFSSEGDWEQQCKALDKSTESEIKGGVIDLLNTCGNEELYDYFFERISGIQRVENQNIGTLISNLACSINAVCGRLLILVDEYDQPIREGLLRLIPNRDAGLYASIKTRISKDYFPNYFGFFGAIKVVLDRGMRAKIWLTGILPIGIKEMSGLNLVHTTFSDKMANAVGLTNNDVQRMLDHVHEKIPFQDGERDQATHWLRQHFNNLGFPGGEPLYHTALINGIMNRLQHDSRSRREFIQMGRVPKEMSVEPVSSVIFDVLCTARNLRHVVNKLVAGDQLQGYKLNYELSLEDFLQDTIGIGDYLTLLVHVGVVSIATDAADTETATFHLSSEFYRKHLVDPMLRTLKASLQKLVSYTSTKDLYYDGEDILVDFVTCISKKSMSKLMAWASSDSKNHILELHFQAQIITEAHDILNGVAHTTQEDRLPGTGKRTDVTFSSASSVVVLELKQAVSEAAPAAAFIANAHKQLRGYVETRRQMEAAGRKRPVAGFVVIMHNDGASYIVEKLHGDIDS